MKLLIITQVVDKNYVPLCFAVEWFREFGKQCDKVTIISQQVGEHALPPNVHVLSLKKEEGKSKLFQVLRFYYLAWKHRSEYEAVFVHMTPIWSVFGGPLWILLRKRVYLWYEARGTGLNLRLGLKFVKKAFSASLGGMPIPTKKSVLTGHGVDTKFFTPQFSSSEPRANPQADEPRGESRSPRDTRLIITVGRKTHAKRLDHIVRAFAELPKEYRLMLVGVPITKADQKTVAELQELIALLGIENRVISTTVPDEELRVLLRKATLFLHASEATSLDKAPLQAMASGCLVVTASPVVKPHVPEICRANPETMGSVTKKLLSLPMEEECALRTELRGIVERGHSLPVLIRRLIAEMHQ